MLTGEQSQQLADMFRLLGEPNRLSLAVHCLGGRRDVSELVRVTGLSQSLVSHHLRLLRAAHLLKAAREGKQVFYAVADDHVRDMLTNMIKHMFEPHPAEL